MLHRLATWIMVNPSLPKSLRTQAGLYAARKPMTEEVQATTREAEAKWKQADPDGYAQYLALLGRADEMLADPMPATPACVAEPEPVADANVAA